jgi:hypothetical protein
VKKFSLLFAVHAGKLVFMNNTQRPPRDFDLPTKHLELRPSGLYFARKGHYVPPKSRDSTEIDRLHSLPRGTKLAELQLKGVQVMRSIFENLEIGDESLGFATKLLSASGLNTAWYGFAQNSSVMRRRLKLPKFDHEDPEQRPSGLMIRGEIVGSLGTAAIYGQLVIDSLKIPRKNEQARTDLGRKIGNISLAASCLSVGDFFGYETEHMSPFAIQHQARLLGFKSLSDARTLGDAIGVAPSIAQLADPDSPLAVFWRSEAPKRAYNAYDNALSALI